VTIVPDTKDWTWVLERPCPECGLDTRSFSREAVAGMIRVNADAWQGVLSGGGSGDARRRPAPGVWSALEYGCHVRDVLRLYDERLGLMLTVDEPHYANWDQDATAVTERYGEQDPATVASELGEAARVIAARFESVSGDQWQRTGVRSDGARFTVESFARYFIHDPVHHLCDVTGIRAAPET
jgi:DinB superfamily